MDSRLHYGEGFSIPQDTEFHSIGHWMLATPQNPIPTGSTSMPVGRYGNQLGSVNLQDLPGFSRGYTGEIPNCNGLPHHFSGSIDQAGRNGWYYTDNAGLAENRMINRMACPFTQALSNENVAWNSNSLASILGMNNSAYIPYTNISPDRSDDSASRPSIPNLNSQISNPKESTFCQLLFPNESPSTSSSLLHKHGKIPQYGFPITYQPYYEMNLPPSIQADAASTVTNPPQFTPVTPEQANKLEKSQLSAIVNPSVDSTEEKDKQPGSIISEINKTDWHNYNELYTKNGSSSSAVVSTTFEEPKDYDPGCQGIDLNQTPQQKPPKRKKHRPKVIVEGKPKRTPKAATTNTTNAKEKPTGKRKYVRQKGIAKSATQDAESSGHGTTQHAELIEETTASYAVHTARSSTPEKKPTGKRKYVRKMRLKELVTPSAASEETTHHSSALVAKSCRRQLKFDLENTRDEGQGNVIAQQEILTEKVFNPDSVSQAAEWSNKAKTMCMTKSAPWIGQQNGLLVKNQQVGATKNLTISINQMPSGCPSISDRHAAAGHRITKDMQVENSNGVAEEMDTRMQHDFQAKRWNKIPLSIGKTRQLMSHTAPQSVPKISSYSIEGRGSKRNHSQVAAIPMSPSVWCKETTQIYDLQISSICIENSTNSTDAQKRKKIENGIETSMHGMAYVAAAKVIRSDAISIESASKTNYEMLNSDLPTHMINETGSSGLKKEDDHCIRSVASTQNMSKQLDSHSCTEKTGETAAKRRGQQPKQKFPSPIEEIAYYMEHISLHETSNSKKGKVQNAIVPYKGDGTIVPYQGFEIIKKRKPRPKVDLDAETERVWKLLMENEGNEDLEGTDKEKEHWWEEERRVFSGRVDSFIARMHLVQGDRRFSKWKGSVVDSVIGVFLTQNVSDHLSSSAFMSMAATFPLKSRTKITDIKGKGMLVEESDACIINPNDPIQRHEKLLGYTLNDRVPHELSENQREGETSWVKKGSIIEAQNHSLEEEVLSSQGSIDSLTVQANGGGRSYSGSISEAEDPAIACKPSCSSSSTDLQMDSKKFFEEFRILVSENSLLCASRHGNKQIANNENEHQRPIPERLASQDASFGCNQQINYNNQQMQILVLPSGNYWLQTTAQSKVLEVPGHRLYGEESISSWPSTASRCNDEKDASCTSRWIRQGADTLRKDMMQQCGPPRHHETPMVDPCTFSSKQSVQNPINSQSHHGNQPHQRNRTSQLEHSRDSQPVNSAKSLAKRQNSYTQHISNVPNLGEEVCDVEERVTLVHKQTQLGNRLVEPNPEKQLHSPNKVDIEANMKSSKARKRKAQGENKVAIDWENLRKQAQANGRPKERSKDTEDSMDYEALRCASEGKISECIRERGMNNMLAERMKEFLNRLVREHGSIDLEWLRDVPPEKAKDYLLSIRGLGLKSVECVRLLTLHHLAFPVDTNVGRIAVRLGWVPLQPLPESLQIHLLELYPILESIQKYLWPRLCKLNQRTLYELHYQMITFGKVFCTKNKPNCNACPMRAECRHFASAFASHADLRNFRQDGDKLSPSIDHKKISNQNARLALPGPEEKSMTSSAIPLLTNRNPSIDINPIPLPPAEDNLLRRAVDRAASCIPIVEEPATPEQECTEVTQSDIEDAFYEDPDNIPTIKLNMEEFSANLQNYVQANMELQEDHMSKALVVLSQSAASIPAPKLKNVSRLRTEHQVYELPDSHPLLQVMDRREPDDPSPYLLAIWTAGETTSSIQQPESKCQFTQSDNLCHEANSQTVRGTLLIPCRTAMRGSFPLNGTYFQVNEMFADHESSVNPIDVPRAWIWNLPRRIVYFGTSVSTIFKGLSTEGIQYCFWRGFICVRGFDQKTRAPRPLVARLHFPASKLAKTRNENQ